MISFAVQRSLYVFNRSLKDIDIKIHVDGKLRGIQDVIYYPPSEMTKTTPTSGTITYTQPAYLELIWNGDE